MSDKDAVKKLLSLLKTYKKVIAIIFFCLLASTGLNLCIPLISKYIMDAGFLGGDRKLLVSLVLLSLGIYGLNACIEMVKEKARIGIFAKIQYSLSEQAFTHLMKLKVNYFNNTNYAEILNNNSVDINNMASVADEGVFFVVTQAFSMAGGIIGLLIIDIRMTLLVLLFIPVKYVIMKYFAKKRKKLVDEYICDNQQYARWFGDSVGGIKEIKLFGIYKEKHGEFAEKQKRVIDKQKQMNLLSQWNMMMDSLMIQVLSSLLYVIGSNLVFHLQLSVGSVFAFITYSAYVTAPISAILNIGYLLSGMIPSTKRFYAFLDLEEENPGERSMDIEEGHIIVKNLSFAYDAGRPVLKNLNIRFPLGSKTALIGKNGSGKTTFIDLLTRLCEPSEGGIYINGKNMKDMTLQSCRNMISVVSQQIYLFDDTIRNNICLYRNGEEDKIWEACRDSGLKEYVEKVTLDYVVGQNGAMLSGGQKQKIALARALFYDRPILLFDEATSNADQYSEQQMNGLLKTRLKNKTVIIISHKTDILSQVDQIVLLREGTAETFASYEALLESGKALETIAEDFQ